MPSGSTRSTYDTFYAQGGWKYGFLREWWWHRHCLVKRFGLRRGQRMLEIACGTGFHTNLFCRMGFDCTGLDICETAIQMARRQYPQRHFQLADVRGDLPFDESRFDVIVTRGCSLYHYDLVADSATETTTHLLRYLRPGGLFVLIIATDLSGSRNPNKIWHNRLEDYQAHFSRFGRPYTTDWYKGMAICSLRQFPAGSPTVSSGAMVSLSDCETALR